MTAFLYLLALQTSSFELGMCEWDSDQPAELVSWTQLKTGHRVASCFSVKSCSNNTEGEKLKLMHSC